MSLNKIIELISNISIYAFIKDIFIPFLGAIGGVVSCWIAYKVYYLERKPNIALDYEVKNDGRFDSLVLNEYLSYEERENARVGFNNSKPDSYNLYLKIKNDSKHLITNFKLKYEISLYKKNLKIDKYDSLEFEDLGYVIFKKVQKEIAIDYIPPGKEIVKLIYISDVIPKCKIDIIYGSSKEKKYFTQRFTLLTLDVFDYVEIEDAPHLRRLYGII